MPITTLKFSCQSQAILFRLGPLHTSAHLRGDDPMGSVWCCPGGYRGRCDNSVAEGEGRGNRRKGEPTQKGSITGSGRNGV